MRISKKTSKINFSQKHRHIWIPRERSLLWGVFGLRVLSRYMICRDYVWSFQIFMKRYYNRLFFRYRHPRRFVGVKIRSRSDYLQYSHLFKGTRVHFYYFAIKRSTPVLRKSNRSRMGKGRGKHVGWVGTARAGSILWEFNIWHRRAAAKIFHVMRYLTNFQIQCVYAHDFQQFTVLGGRSRILSYQSNTWRFFAKKHRVKPLQRMQLRRGVYSL